MNNIFVFYFHFYFIFIFIFFISIIFFTLLTYLLFQSWHYEFFRSIFLLSIKQYMNIFFIFYFLLFLLLLLFLFYLFLIVEELAATATDAFGNYIPIVLPLLLSSLSVPKGISAATMVKNDFITPPLASLEQTLHCYNSLRGDI